MAARKRRKGSKKSKKGHKKAKSNHIPLAILEKRLHKLARVVASRKK